MPYINGQRIRYFDKLKALRPELFVQNHSERGESEVEDAEESGLEKKDDEKQGGEHVLMIHATMHMQKE